MGRMIVGLGVDIVEVARFERRLPSEPGLIDDLFTNGERKYCESKANSAVHFAGRFAAKEAFLKAIGLGWSKGIRFREIEITTDPQGKPTLELWGRAQEVAHSHSAQRVHLSLSHEMNYAVAVVILED